MNQIRPSLVLAAATALSCFGCDDDDDEGVPIYVSGVDADGRPVADLSADEKRQICGSFDGYVNATVGFDQIIYAACLPAAVVLGGSREGCERVLDDCMKNKPSPIAVRARVQNEVACFSYLDRCDLSVAELEGCVNLNFAWILRILENFSCAGASDDGARSRAEELMQTAMVCADANAACQEFASVPQVH
jgi:hypothetical protein